LSSLAGRSYYGQPVLKEPVWTPEIPVYFFTGGLGGASAGLAFLSELRGNEELARRAWAASFAGLAVSPPLLISDLGVPRRFLNMLRMFKVTSPMSVGSWLLAATVPAVGVAAANAWTGVLPRVSRIARPAAAVLGLPISTYTAALISNTSIPVWHEARGRMAFVFASGAAASAGAVAVAVAPVDAAGPARRLALGGAAVELIGLEVMKRGLGELAEPYREGRAGRYSKLGGALTIGGAGALAGGGGRSRLAAVAGGALLAAGALAERFAIFRAGFQSAADPRYVVGPQRGRIERGETRGAARAPGC
jgi:polysulfide reductase-like protein